MKISIFLFLLFAACLSISSFSPALAMQEGEAAGITLRYEVAIPDPSIPKVEIRLNVEGLPPRKRSLDLAMAERYAFVRLEEPLMEGDVAAADRSGQSLAVTRKSPFLWKVETGGCEALRLQYCVPLSHRDLPAVKGRDEYEHPYLDPDHGMLVTGALFLVPQGLDLETMEVAFALPDGWAVLCPWKERSPGTFQPKSRMGLYNDLVAVGRWEDHRISAGGMEITMAFAPGQEGLKETAAPLIEKIVRAEVALFGRAPLPRYLFLFGKPMASGFAGSPKTGSMTLSVNPMLQNFLPREHMGHLIAHEFFHLWAHARYQCPDELRFFAEGFTDYYAYRVLAGEEITTWKDFYRTLGRCMDGCEKNPKQGVLSLAEAGGDIFFSDRSAGDLVYQGGLLAAALLDASIRKARPGSSLDDFMRAFNNDPRWSWGVKAPCLNDFFLCIEGFLGTEGAERFQKLVEKPYALDPCRAFPEAGVEVKRSGEKGVYSVGSGPWAGSKEGS